MLLLLLGVLIVQIVPFGDGQPPEAQSISLVGEYSGDEGAWKSLVEAEAISDYGSIVVRGRFSRDVPAGLVLTVPIHNLTVKMTVAGKPLLTHGEGDSHPYFARAPGVRIAMIISPGITVDDEVELYINNPYKGLDTKSSTVLLKGMTIGYGYELYAKMVAQEGINFLVGIAVLLIGVFALVLTIIFRGKNCYANQQELAFSFFSFSGGVYMLVDTFFCYLPLLVRNSVLCNVIDVLPVYLLAIALNFYFATVLQNENTRRAMKIGCLLTLLLAVLAVGAQLAGISDLYESKFIISPIMTASTFLGAGMLLYEYACCKRRRAGMVLATFFPILIAVILEVCNAFGRFMPSRVLVGIGMLLTVTLQLAYLLDISKQQHARERRIHQVEQELLQSQVSIMLSQIQPHFLYNALNTIEYLCESQPRKAAEIVGHFAEYLRGNMDSLSQRSPIPFRRELQHLENYLSIERLRFPDVNIIYNLQCTDFSLPVLTVQPLVENAIRYGARSRQSGGTVTISSWEDKTGYVICIADDGNGFDSASILQDERSHIGINNTRARIASMCNGTLDIKSIAGQGTQVIVKIPKKGG